MMKQYLEHLDMHILHVYMHILRCGGNTIGMGIFTQYYSFKYSDSIIYVPYKRIQKYVNIVWNQYWYYVSNIRGVTDLPLLASFLPYSRLFGIHHTTI